ncbi:MAG: FAD-dependent oxidoreductase [Verrucomicrobia bacterium]|jgi:protoporphyrinogen oxidase|nr:FAD-dependent oxidoreductase [Verrucomicrobiota bacterium]
MQTHPTLIIGAGLTGLSCAYHLGHDYLLVEKEDEPGGIVRTRNRHGGFLCDGTGHWLHLRNPAMQALVNKLLPGQLVEHERKAMVHLRGVFTPYPFQANTYGLPREVVLDCLLGLLKARHPEDFGLAAPAAPPRNFRESVERLFGEGICKNFMAPYNEKLMAVKLEEISASYADRFIPRPSLEDVVKGTLGFSRESLGYNAKFVYPREGGISALPRALAKAIPVPPRYETTVTRVDVGKKTATLSTGESIRFRNLVNTMPLKNFVDIVTDAPARIRAAAAKLRATTVHYFDIGVRGPGDAASRHHWIYFPEPDYVFYRVGSYSAVHAGAAPPGCRSYYVEMSGGDAVGLLSRPDELKARVLADLKRARVLSAKDEVLFMELCNIPHAYVIYDEHYEPCRKEILDYLGGNGIQSGGRWGGWNYGGMEDALLEGLQAAQRSA